MEHGEQVHLLLSAPGQPPLILPPSSWRAWHATERGPVDPVAAAAGFRLSPVSPRAERALVATVANDDVDGLGRLAGQSGPAQEAAQVLWALRIIAIDPAQGLDGLLRVVTAPADLAGAKLLRRHWADLGVHVALAPGVPALVGLGRTALALLAAELLIEQGRTADAIGLLESLPPSPPVVLAKAATLLGHGEHQRVISVTDGLPNVDDVTALTYVARSVAARTLQDLPTALDAVCEALSAASQNCAVIAAGLEERAHIYRLAGEAKAAHEDLEALAALAAGQVDVTVPRPSLLRRGDETPEESGLDRARNRLRRRITGVGAPGTFGGRHHSTYRDEIATMFSLGQVEAVEDLLICLLDAVEDEVDELGAPLDATFFLTLADLYQDNNRTEDLHALRERYAAAEARSRQAIAAAAAAAEAEPAAATPAVAVDVTTGEQGSVAETSPEGPTVVAPPIPAAHVEPSAAERLAGAEPTSPVATAVRIEKTDDAVAPDAVAPAAEADDVTVVPPEEAPEADPTVPAVERELTPVERAVRGPRVRSL